MMENQAYQQYQFTLPSEDVVADNIAELAHLLGLPFDDEDYDDFWFDRVKDHAYLVRDPEKDPNVFILVALREEGEFDQLVIRCKDEDAEKVKGSIRKVWKEGAIRAYASGQIGPDFTNKLNDPDDWIPYFVNRFGLDLHDII